MRPTQEKRILMFGFILMFSISLLISVFVIWILKAAWAIPLLLLADLLAALFSVLVGHFIFRATASYRSSANPSPKDSLKK
jgi:hypothetical protein